VRPAELPRPTVVDVSARLQGLAQTFAIMSILPMAEMIVVAKSLAKIELSTALCDSALRRACERVTFSENT